MSDQPCSKCKGSGFRPDAKNLSVESFCPECKGAGYIHDKGKKVEMKITIVKPGFEIMTPVGNILQLPRLLEQAGRTCYKSEGKITEESAEKFVRAIIKSGHESVIEHGNITVKIIGDRSMSHQLVRHRIAAFSQESQRYCDYGKLSLQVICPPKIGEIAMGTYEEEAFRAFLQDDRMHPWALSIITAYRSYLRLREFGVPPEDARSVLPNAVKTEVVTTFNLRQWRHVFQERALNKHAQWQIREILLSVLQKFAELLPCAFDDLLKTHTLPVG